MLWIRPLPLHCLPCDIAPAKAVRPLDPVDRLVGARLRLRDRLAQRADVEHASAVGEDGAVCCRRASVKDLDALDLGGRIKPLSTPLPR